MRQTSHRTTAASAPRPAPDPASIPVAILLIALSFAPLTVLAGVNEGGMLILHADPTQQFSVGDNMSGRTWLRDCEDAIIEVPADETPIVFYVFAAFDGFASPRIKAMTFGIDYSSTQVEPVAWGTNADFEIAMQGWPYSLTGTGLSFSQPLRGTLNEVYWFASYTYGPNTFKLIAHPDHGGYFADDSLPAVKDEIEEYGILGIGKRGYNPCLADQPVLGACCDRNGECFLLLQQNCEFQGNTFLGANTSCSPNPCVPGIGACCIGVDCQLLAWDECLDARGIFIGDGEPCDPTPCDFSRVETSWGGLKSIFRDN